MKITFTRWLCLALVLLMMLPVLAACGDSDQTDAPTTTAPTAADTTAEPVPETTSPYDENGYLRDTLPEDLTFKNGNNPTDFIILGWKHGVPEFEVEAETGDIVNDAIYQRNRKTEERLGVKLSYEIIPGNSGAFNEYCKTVMTGINANAQTYDALACYSRSAGVLTVNRMLIDMLELDYLNFDMPWWSETLVEMNNIHDKLFFVSGDIATTTIYQMMLVVYNNTLGTDLGLQNPQKLALEGKWTQEVMFEMASNVYQDVDNDGQKSIGDQYGLFSNSHPNLDIFYMGSDMTYVIPDENGDLSLSADYFSEKSITVVDRLINIYKGNDGFFKHSVKIADNNFKSLFYNTSGADFSAAFRTSDIEYAILPAPKFDEKQEEYKTCITITYTNFCIPLDAKNPDMTAAVLECMASEAYRRTTPAIFETAFKYQYAQSQDDADIFDLIRAGVVFDLGRTFHDDLGGDGAAPVRKWRTHIENLQNQLAVSQAMFERLWTKSLANTSAKLVPEG